MTFLNPPLWLLITACLTSLSSPIMNAHVSGASHVCKMSTLVNLLSGRLWESQQYFLFSFTIEQMWSEVLSLLNQTPGMLFPVFSVNWMRLLQKFLVPVGLTLKVRCHSRPILGKLWRIRPLVGINTAKTKILFC